MFLSATYIGALNPEGVAAPPYCSAWGGYLSVWLIAPLPSSTIHDRKNMIVGDLANHQKSSWE